VLGNQTLRFQYGWDPATEVLYGIDEGLKLTGRGFVACPVHNRALEQLVEVPIGTDWPLVCSRVWMNVVNQGTASEHGRVVLSKELVAAPTVQHRSPRHLHMQETSHQPSKAPLSNLNNNVDDQLNMRYMSGSNLLLSRLRRQAAAAAHPAVFPDATSRRLKVTSWASDEAAVPGAGMIYLHLLDRSRNAASTHAWRKQRSSAALPANGTDSDDGLFDFLKHLAHHMPGVIFDGLMRVLKNGDIPGVDACTLAAMQLPQCVISDKCASAVRQDPAVSGRCATCGQGRTCGEYWARAAGKQCDSDHLYWSGCLCYSGVIPPGLAGLLGFW